MLVVRFSIKGENIDQVWVVFLSSPPFWCLGERKVFEIKDIIILIIIIFFLDEKPKTKTQRTKGGSPSRNDPDLLQESQRGKGEILGLHPL